jgi:drug/metabolite transporter (DMT)-like permease
VFPILRIEENGPRLLLLGTVQLTIPYLLYSLAIRHVRALDASIISTIEPILNPIWVMLATNERPGIWSIVGGAIVLGTSLTRSVSRNVWADRRIDGSAKATRSMDRILDQRGKNPKD